MKLKDFDFRIWDKTKEEFLKKEPTLIKIDNERVIAGRISRFYANTADITDMFIGNGNDLEIELWTGYFDKNGKKIYEGDILENKMTMEDLPYKVVFKWGVFYLVEIDGNDEDLMSEFLFMELEVIGNIHENAELLEVKE
ncbi:YopX family protein [Campylobacter jejuni]